MRPFSQANPSELTPDEREARRYGFDYMPSPEELALARFAKIKSDLDTAVTQHIDKAAQSRGYGDGGKTPMLATISILSYLNDTNAIWATESARFKAWRSEVWLYCIGAMGQAMATPPTRALPTTQEIVAELEANVPINWTS